MVSEYSSVYQVALLFSHLLTMSWLVWVFSSIILHASRTLGKPKPPVVNLLWYWYKPLAHAYILTYWPALIFLREPHWWNVLDFAILLWCWKKYKDVGDDDDHKKLKKKVKESVKVLNGRLVVQPG